MPNKYDADNYSITLFDRRGVKQGKHALGNVGLIRAKEFGRKCISQGEAHSYVIERVLCNSLDANEAWLPKATGRYSDGKPYRQEN